jgi:hypothetical protein
MVVFHVAAGLIAAPAAALPITQAPQKSGQSVYEEISAQGTMGWRIVNTSFFRNGNAVLTMRVEHHAPKGGNPAEPGVLDVSAVGVAGGQRGQKLLQFHVAGDDDGPWGDYFRSTLRGCCGAKDVSTYHALDTGRLASIATAQPVFVELANAHPARALAVSYVSNHSSLALDFTRRHPGAFGLLTLREGQAIVDRVALQGHDGRFVLDGVALPMGVRLQREPTP